MHSSRDRWLCSAARQHIPDSSSALQCEHRCVAAAADTSHAHMRARAQPLTRTLAQTHACVHTHSHKGDQLHGSDGGRVDDEDTLDELMK